VKGVINYPNLRNEISNAIGPDGFICKSTTTHIKYKQTLLIIIEHLGLHLRNKILTLNDRFRLLRPLLTSNHVKLPTKLLIYKLFLKPIWVYGIQLWGSAKFSNINKIQRFQSKTLRAITKAPYYVSNHSLHNDLAILPVQDINKIFYKWFNLNLKKRYKFINQRSGLKKYTWKLKKKKIKKAVVSGPTNLIKKKKKTVNTTIVIIIPFACFFITIIIIIII
jgi:hypothetical protein